MQCNFNLLVYVISLFESKLLYAFEKTDEYCSCSGFNYVLLISNQCELQKQEVVNVILGKMKLVTLDKRIQFSR